MTALLACALAGGCASSAHHGSAPSSRPTSAPTSRPSDDPLTRVAAIHGGVGPFAVAGYRMGQRALAELGLERGSFDIEVVHYTPDEVQYSCVADGLQAATGASAGRLQLRLEPATRAGTHSVVRNKRTGAELTLRLAPAFLERYLNVPRPQLYEKGREVLDLPQEQVFTRDQGP